MTPARSPAPRTRFAPSPTGDLHLGGAWTALASWVVARRAGGRSVLRIEDIDLARVVPGSAARIVEDLSWLGLDWDEGPFVQSQRTAHYEEAIATMAAAGLVYPCDCSRAEIELVASAPHEGQEVVYPGTCRDRDPARAMKRPPALRVRVPDERFTAQDGLGGPFTQNLQREVGDFVLRRGDGAFAYQLAVVVDDLDMRISHVVRGVDLLSSAPRQMWLARALGGAPPSYLHLPLVVAADGTRLQKRTAGAVVRDLRQAGVEPSSVVGALAHGLGLAATSRPVTPGQLAAALEGREIAWRREPWSMPAGLTAS